MRQSGKKAGERVLGFVEVGDKSGSGGERKVSFRSRRPLARPPARPLARIAEASPPSVVYAVPRCRGLADGIIPRLSGAARLDLAISRLLRTRDANIRSAATKMAAR